MIDIHKITSVINGRAANHAVGNLQNIRQELNRRRPPTHKIFDPRTISDDGWAFHVGGRRELQFNIGTEYRNGIELVRYGVAFSLETSRTFPTIEVLRHPVARFNEFLREQPDEFSDLRMWGHYRDIGTTQDYIPVPIPDDRFQLGAFIFLGALGAEAALDYEEILDTFDRLLPLFRYVQGEDDFPSVSEPSGAFAFRPGCSIKSSGATASIPQRELDITLRHNDLQVALHAHLSARFGENAVGTETVTVRGCKIDAVVRQESGYWFYEIKTAFSIRSCIRAAIGQLMEYSFWPGAQQAERLIIIGEKQLDDESEAYLELLRNRFALPIYYQQFEMASGNLIIP